jgi:hypothetical protein
VVRRRVRGEVAPARVRAEVGRGPEVAAVVPDLVPEAAVPRAGVRRVAVRGVRSASARRVAELDLHQSGQRRASERPGVARVRTARGGARPNGPGWRACERARVAPSERRQDRLLEHPPRRCAGAARGGKARVRSRARVRRERDRASCAVGAGAVIASRRWSFVRSP